MERPLPRRRARDDHDDFGWGPARYDPRQFPFALARASQLAGQGAPSSCSSPVRQDDRERRRRRRRNSGERERDGSGRRGKGGGREERLALPTDYRSALAKFSPPVPHALLKKIGTKDVQGLGKADECVEYLKRTLLSPKIPQVISVAPNETCRRGAREGRQGTARQGKARQQHPASCRSRHPVAKHF